MQMLTDFYIRVNVFSSLNVTYNHFLNMETSLIGKALNFGFREYRFESYVSNILILSNSYPYLLTQLKLAFAKKAFFINLFLTQQITNLLIILKKLNVIRRFQIINRKMCRIFPTYNKFLIPTAIIKNYARLKRPIYLKLQALKLINLSLNHSVFILETSKGLLTSTEAVKFKLGGLLICKIN